MSCVPVFICWNGRKLVVWDCDKYTVGSAGVDLVLKELNISEKDYFGLQYTGKTGTVRWLNLRNPTLRELKIAGATTPYQVVLHVKFFVPPKQLFLPETRLAFYMDIRENILNKSFSVPNSFMPRVISLLAQIDLGDASEDMSEVYKEKYGPIWDDSLTDLVYARHLTLAKTNKDKNVADFLREVSALGDYGVEYHKVMGHNGKVLMIQLGVKDLGVYIDADHSKGTKIPLKDLNGAKVKGKSIFFSTSKYKASIVPMSPTVPNNRVIADLELEFAEEQDARIIYRALLERHLFYCRSTASDLSENPHFNSRWELIKAKIHPNKADKYRLFSYDVTRTAKEAFQHNKKLFSFNPSDVPDSCLPQSPLINSTIANSITNTRQWSPSTLAQRRPMTAEDMEPHVYFGKPRRKPLTRTSSLKGEHSHVSRSTAIGIPHTPKTAFETSSSGSDKFTFSPPSDNSPLVFNPLPPTPTPLSPSTTFSFVPSMYSLKLKDAKTAPESISSSTGSSSPEEEALMNFADTLPLVSNMIPADDQPLLLDPVPANKSKSRPVQDSGDIPPPLPARIHKTKPPCNGFHANNPFEPQTPPPPPPKSSAFFAGVSDSDITTSSVMSSPEVYRKFPVKFTPSESQPLSLQQTTQFISDEQKSRADWECKLCMDSSISTVFIPCGHMLFCRACAHKVRNCPLCNMEILLTQTVYLPSNENRKETRGQKPVKASSCTSSLSPSLSPSVSSDLKFEDSSNENIFESWKVSQLAH